ncbi:signal protein PDZ [Rubinisphaera margarita]|uniref:signal protein PDZ n=1 Tax=Rubinisphaera margarita TaxID=2909586 RepID=UPI001EE7AA29|nr:signal protein PDZ [Rubinisphaera margarita]MCG6157606.1 signal protein PDZ [Rubinisphaera margarita]
MTRFTLALVAVAAVATLSTNVEAGGCSSYKSYGYKTYNYRKTYDYGHCRKPVYAKPIVREVVIEKPVIREVIVQKPVCETGCKKPLPSLGFFGVICAEGMLVKEVMPNSEACRLGLAPGDVIKTFDDIRIICEDDWLHALDCAGPTACLQVVPCGEHRLIEMHAHLEVGLKY